MVKISQRLTPPPPPPPPIIHYQHPSRNHQMQLMCRHCYSARKRPSPCQQTINCSTCRNGQHQTGLQWKIILLLLLLFNKPDRKTQAHQLPGPDCILLRIWQTQFKEILFGKPDRKTQTHQLLGPVYILLYLRRL